MDTIEKAEVDPADMKLQKAVQGEGGCEMTPEDFKDLISDRKAERKRKAEEKRLEGLRRIAEMKSKEGIDPLSQFPKEIWLMILEKVTPADRANMYHLHPIFSDLLEGNKIQDILFPLVVDFKIPFWESLLHDDNGRVNLHTLLDLRLVSKLTRDSIDKWIEDDLLNSMKGLRMTPRFSPIRIDSMTKLHQVLARLSDPDPNGPKRLTIRALQIQISPWSIWNNSRNELDDFANFNESIRALLRKIGDQILYFELHYFALNRLDDLYSFGRIYNALGEYLSLMANLKWLDIRIASFDVFGFLRRTPRWMARAREITQNEPIPRMIELERVHFWGWKEFPIWDAILVANPHVKYHTHREMNISNQCKLVRFTDPSVLALGLESLNARDDYCDEPWDMPMLQQVTESKWKLREISVEMRGQVEPIDMGAVLECLQKFPTVEDVSLAINNVTIGNGIDLLMLPNLKKFQIMLRPMMMWTVGFHHFFSLQFLLKCGNLESITWNALLNHTRIIHREMEELESNNAQMDFKGGWGDLSLSKLWDVFPYLMCVQVNLYGMIGDQCKPYIRKYGSRKLESEENPGLSVD